MKKINALILPAAAAIAAPNLSAKKTEAVADSAAKRPNIVYIMTDDHTQQMMSAYDRRHIETPNLDRISGGERGVRFTNSFVANSLSGPSRACLLTGKHSHTNGFRSNETDVFDSSQPTFPKYLQQAGYETAIFGKWHLHTLPTGFDKWEIVPGQGDYYNPQFITMDNDTIVEHGYLTNLITDKSIDWMESKRDKDKPFCLMIHHKAIHRNWLADTCDLELYEDKQFALPDNFYDDYEGRRAAKEQEMSIASAHDMDIAYDNKILLPGVETRLSGSYRHMLSRMDSAQIMRWHRHYAPIIADFLNRDLKGDLLTEWKYQRYMKDYAKVVASLDRNVGRVLDYLRDHDMLDNTLVVYASDQGFYMGEHGWFDKRFMYEESMRTPLVMHLPKGYETKGDVEELVQNIDYAPTFLELAGVEKPKDMQGKSFVPLLKDGKNYKFRDALYYHFHEFPAEHMAKRHYGIRTDRYKLIHFYNDIDQWELYDLQADPTEMHNLYGEPGTDKLVKKLKKRLKELQEEYDDPIRFEYKL